MAVQLTQTPIQDFRILEENSSETRTRNRDDSHIGNLKVFTNDLKNGLEGAFPVKLCPYTSVHVLLLRWVEDDLRVQTEISKLKRVFQHQFNFEVEECHIPSLDSYHSLQETIFNFQKAHQSEYELLIVYYGGHAERDPGPQRSIWHA